ncbi:MAG: condensation domain-containing protein, partial [Bacteroidota bacterium]
MKRIIGILTSLRKRRIVVRPDASGTNLQLSGEVKLLTVEDQQELRELKSELLTFLLQKKKAGNALTRSAIDSNKIPLAPNQKSIWLQDQLHPGENRYLIPLMESFRDPGFSLARFRSALEALVKKHDAFSYIFFTENGMPFQRQAKIDIDQHFSVYHLEDHKSPTDVVRSIINESMEAAVDISQQAPWKICLFGLPNHQYDCFLCMHHLIADGDSLNIAVADLLQLYRSGPDAIPPMDGIRYADYAHWINDKSKHISATQFWQKEFEGYEETFVLEKIHSPSPRTDNASF